MNAKISCTALKYCVSHGCGDGAEVFTRAMSKFAGFGRFGSGACAVHESLSVCSLCSMCMITGSKNKNMLNTSTVNHKLLLEPFLQCVDTLRRIENKQIYANIESNHLIVKCTKVAARYDTGSNQQPTSA